MSPLFCINNYNGNECYGMNTSLVNCYNKLWRKRRNALDTQSPETGTKLSLKMKKDKRYISRQNHDKNMFNVYFLHV